MHITKQIDLNMCNIAWLINFNDRVSKLFIFQSFLLSCREGTMQLMVKGSVEGVKHDTFKCAEFALE